MALAFVFSISLAANRSSLASALRHYLSIDAEAVQEEPVVPLNPEKTPLEIADSICSALDVPFELVLEIGKNESGWRYIKNTSGGTDMGDLQVIDQTYDYWYDRLALTGGKNRRNYLIVGINYLRYQYDRYGSWRKARFAYGRGSWRDESTWTCLEQKFMNKIDWTKYDSEGYVRK